MKNSINVTVLVIMITLSYSVSAQFQNLIPNPGFELFLTCPNQLSKSALFWTNIEWTPDYYNSCAPGNTCSVPENYFGYQNAHSGCGYEGMVCFDSNAPNGREILQVKLDSTLILGVKYYISYSISLHNGYPGFWTGTNKFGCKLSINSFSPGMVDGSPAIDNVANYYSDSIVIDTIGWVTIQGSFIADSAYNYITFGCFFDDQHVQQIVLNGPRIFTYYYLDDVCLSSDSATCISVSQQCYVPNGIEEYDVKRNLVYPNPVSREDGVIHLNIQTEQKYTLHLFNLLGESLFAATGNKYDLESQLKSTVKKYNPGMYQLNLLNEKQESFNAKISIY